MSFTKFFYVILVHLDERNRKNCKSMMQITVIHPGTSFFLLFLVEINMIMNTGDVSRSKGEGK